MQPQITKVTIKRPYILTCTESSVPKVSVEQYLSGFDFTRMFKGEKVIENDYVKCDISNALVGSPCYIERMNANGSSRYVSNVLTETLEMMQMRAYYALCSKQTQHPLARSRLSKAIENLDRSLTQLLKEDAVCLNVVLASCEINETHLTYYGMNCQAFLIDELSPIVLEQSLDDIIKIDYNGQAKDRVLPLIEQEMQAKLSEYVPPNIFGFNALNSADIDIDLRLYEFCLEHRHLLSSISSDLFRLNAFSEINSVNKHFNSGLKLSSSLERLSANRMKTEFKRFEMLHSIKDLIDTVFSTDVQLISDFSSQLDINASSKNLSLALNFMSLRDFILLAGHPSTVVTINGNKIRVGFSSGYVELNNSIGLQAGESLKYSMRLYREIIKLSTSLFNCDSARLVDGKLRVDLKAILEKELRIHE